MATHQDVSSISYNGTTNKVEISHGATPIQTDYSVSSGQTFQMTRNGSVWDIDVTTGELSTEIILMKFLESHVNIDFGEDLSGGTWYYSIIVIGEDDIRDGLHSEDNQLMVGMESSAISLKVSSGIITIKKDR